MSKGSKKEKEPSERLTRDMPGCNVSGGLNWNDLMEIFPSDITILDLLRKCDSMSVAELSQAMGVTATAVRQRLTRLMGQGYVVRRAERSKRGRPAHRYELTAAGRRKAGANFADLAMVLWEEIRRIEDPDVRRGLLQRVSARLASMYSQGMEGTTLRERLESIARLFGERNVPLVVDEAEMLPVLSALACPYPDLAEKDRAICAMERQMISDLAGESMRLSECRLDGDTRCAFTVSRSHEGAAENSAAPTGASRGADEESQT